MSLSGCALCSFTVIIFRFFFRTPIVLSSSSSVCVFGSYPNYPLKNLLWDLRIQSLSCISSRSSFFQLVSEILVVLMGSLYFFVKLCQNIFVNSSLNNDSSGRDILYTFLQEVRLIFPVISHWVYMSFYLSRDHFHRCIHLYFIYLYKK